ncbi:MAG: RNA methyltransferase [Candidatus Omnitrophica bacterium]|nr:RNA methyltransferase [Candidatus Omnitrophota bacterium]
MIEKISSLQNAGIKRVVRLRTKKSREARGLTIVEGNREVRQAFLAGLRFHSVYICREGVYHVDEALAKELLDARVKIYDTGCAVFGKMSYGDRVDGILGLVERPEVTLENLKLSANPLIVVMEGVEKPGNLGAVLRTCDGAGVEALIVCDEKTDIYNPNVIRASLGAVFAVQTVSCTNKEAVEFLRMKGVKTFAAVVQAKEFYYDKDLSGPCAIVMGSEQDGLSDLWRRSADDAVRIPMCGKVDSLNVSVSAAVMVYEALRQRGKI